MRLEFPCKLVISPILNEPAQLASGAAAVDLRLGQEIMTADPSLLACMDPLAGDRHEETGGCDNRGDDGDSRNEDEETLIGYLRTTCLPLGGEFILHPRQFALAATLEYIRLPPGLAGHVVGRSRWARVGLIIAMATFVHPGYSGCLTLELENLGDVPMRLSPGFPVAQLILEQVTAEADTDAGQLTCAIGPEFLPLLSDADKPKLRHLREIHRILTGDEGWGKLAAYQSALADQACQSGQAARDRSASDHN